MRFAYILALCLLAISCSDKKNEIPINVLNQEKFSDVLVDFTLAEAASGMNVLNYNGNNIDSVYAFSPFIDNNITKKDFDTTLYFYCHHPKLFREVYELTLEKLNRIQVSRK